MFSLTVLFIHNIFPSLEICSIQTISIRTYFGVHLSKIMHHAIKVEFTSSKNHMFA